jgi:mono/diheme cytochrome c family protein
MHRRMIARRIWIGVAALGVTAAVAAPVTLGGREGNEASTRAAQPAGNIARGYQIFYQFHCYACHRFKAAGPDAHGIVGVDLNKKKVPVKSAVAVVINGLPAALPLYPTQMVGYKGVLTTQQVNDVAAFVAKYSGTYNTCAECPPTPYG